MLEIGELLFILTDFSQEALHDQNKACLFTAKSLQIQEKFKNISGNFDAEETDLGTNKKSEISYKICNARRNDLQRRFICP